MIMTESIENSIWKTVIEMKMELFSDGSAALKTLYSRLIEQICLEDYKLSSI